QRRRDRVGEQAGRRFGRGRDGRARSGAARRRSGAAARTAGRRAAIRRARLLVMPPWSGAPAPLRKLVPGTLFQKIGVRHPFSRNWCLTPIFWKRVSDTIFSGRRLALYLASRAFDNAARLGGVDAGQSPERSAAAFSRARRVA